MLPSAAPVPALAVSVLGVSMMGVSVLAVSVLAVRVLGVSMLGVSVLGVSMLGVSVPLAALTGSACIFRAGTVHLDANPRVLTPAVGLRNTLIGNTCWTQLDRFFSQDLQTWRSGL